MTTCDDAVHDPERDAARVPDDAAHDAERDALRAAMRQPARGAAPRCVSDGPTREPPADVARARGVAPIRLAPARRVTCRCSTNRLTRAVASRRPALPSPGTPGDRTPPVCPSLQCEPPARASSASLQCEPPVRASSASLQCEPPVRASSASLQRVPPCEPPARASMRASSASLQCEPLPDSSHPCRSERPWTSHDRDQPAFALRRSGGSSVDDRHWL